MRATRDLIAGALNSIWSALITFAVVPFYLRYLGVEAYGLIALFATTQAVLQFLDLGLAPTINRETARHRALGRAGDVGPLLGALSRIYWIVAVAIAVLGYACSGPIAEHWLNATGLSVGQVRESVVLLCLSVACRWPVGLYLGVLMGSERLSAASAVNMVMTTLGSSGAAVVLAYFSPTLEAFFLWQATAGLLYALVMRRLAWQAVGRPPSIRFDFGEIRRIWRFSAGMSGVALSGIVLMQLDKIILSKILSLQAFAYYALAGVIGSGLYVILTPTFNVIYPRLSALVATGSEEDVARLYRQGTRLLSCILFPIAIGAAIFSYELVVWWTGDRNIAHDSAAVVSLFLIGTALNGAMHFPYALQLAYGQARLPLVINGILLVLLIPLTILLAGRFGALGGAASWATLNSIYLVIGTWLTHRVLLRGQGLRWLSRDVLLPLLASVLAVGGLGGALRQLSSDPATLLLGGALMVATVAVVLAVASPGSRRLIARSLPGGGTVHQPPASARPDWPR